MIYNEENPHVDNQQSKIHKTTDGKKASKLLYNSAAGWAGTEALKGIHGVTAAKVISL